MMDLVRFAAELLFLLGDIPMLIIIILIGYILLRFILELIGYTAKASKVIYYESKKKHRIKEINDPTIRKKIWKTRTEELALNFENAIYVLCFFDNECNAGIYKYLWYEDGALAYFSAPKIYGDFTITISPEKWKVHYIEKSAIEGFYKRRNYCQLNLKDESPLYFSIGSYNKMLQLLNDNGIV